MSGFCISTDETHTSQKNIKYYYSKQNENYYLALHYITLLLLMFIQGHSIHVMEFKEVPVVKKELVK